MQNTIALVQSKTFWGALLALVAVVAQAFGLANIQAFASDPGTVTAILNVAAFAGAAFAIFGRAVATAKVTSVLPKSSS